MTPDRRLQHFHRLAEAPDAIPRLRRFILDLAVRGKLVEQDPNDEPASELLKRIQAETACFTGRVKIRKQQPLTEVETGGLPFNIPSSWIWARLGGIGRTQTGTTPSKNLGEYSGDHIPFIKPADLYSRYVDYANYGLSETGLKHSGRIAPAGSLLMVCIGTIGKCQLIDRDCSFNQQINALSPVGGISSRFILAVFRCEYFQQAAWATSACTTIAILNKGKWEQLLIPLPPLAEQHRIVAKVEELMALCDKLEAVQKERESRRDRLVAASLARLNNGADSNAFRAHARFHLSNLPKLTTRPEHIKQLRKTILGLAVRGRLVRQDPNDEPAAELLKRIQAEKAQLVKSGKIKKLDTAAISEAEEPFAIPCNWTWTRLSEAGDWGSGSTPPRGSHDSYGGSITWLKSGELNDIQHLRSSDETVTEAAVHKYSFRQNQPGDVLIAMYGATIGKLAILAESAVTNQAVCGCTPFSGVFNRYLFSFLLSQRAQFHLMSEGGAQPNISKVKLGRFAFPLPPLAEQHRIVAKVDELMALCDRLEAQLNTAQTESRRLLESILHEAIAT